MDEAENLCDRIAIMNNGKLADAGYTPKPDQYSCKSIKVSLSAPNGPTLDWLKNSAPCAHFSGRQAGCGEGDVPVLALVASELD